MNYRWDQAIVLELRANEEAALEGHYTKAIDLYESVIEKKEKIIEIYKKKGNDASKETLSLIKTLYCLDFCSTNANKLINRRLL